MSDAMSLIEWLIIFSQMSQIVAYNFDDIERNYSDTFWLRLAKAEMKKPNQYGSDQILVSGGINKTQIISMNGGKWRTFNMAGETADSNVKFTGKLAYKVPAKEQSGGYKMYKGEIRSVFPGRIQQARQPRQQHYL